MGNDGRALVWPSAVSIIVRRDETGVGDRVPDVCFAKQSGVEAGAVYAA
jgi:hypothetical protein